jgi:phenylpropionate dioxygenase-like ring-hydroxylating dioxygenase large terminal subunit
MTTMTIATALQQPTQTATGGPDPEKFDPTEAWYPVHYLNDLNTKAPNAFTLLGKDLVIWWEPHSSTWRAMVDQCPHRLARLSEGRINHDGQLECPYHGWSFTGSGECDRIPQQLAGGVAEKSQRACVQSFPTTAAQDLLFVYLGNSTPPALPLVAPITEEPEGWVTINTFRDLPYDAFTLMENVLDASHLPYTHHNTVGNRSNAAPVELQILTSDKHGFTGIWPEGPRKGKLGTQNTTFIAPGLMWHDLTSKQFGRTITVVYATPIRPGECRLFARFPFKFPKGNIFPSVIFKFNPQWYAHIGQHTILEDDQIFLHHQERYLAERSGNFTKAFYLPTKADLYVFEFRQWIDRYQPHFFPGVPLPPAQSKQQLLDRYHSHTINCQSCSGALNNLQKLRWVFGSTAFGGWVWGSTLTMSNSDWWPIAAVIAGLSLLGRWQCGQLIDRLHRGHPIPPRNRAEKPSSKSPSTHDRDQPAT